MKLVVPHRSLMSLLHWTQRALFVVGVLTLGYYGYVIAEGWVFQRDSSQQFDRPYTALQPAVSQPGTFVSGGSIGRIEIERLGVSVVVVEGISSSVLRRAVGHIPGTALPGQLGNVALSGHRDTYFRPLRNIRRDDIITLKTLSGDYRYRVVSTKITSPKDIAVLEPGVAQVLTLVTCYPFYFIGSAPNRFIVRAERVS